MTELWRNAGDAVDPQCNGPCTVELTYDGGAEGRISRWLSRLALGAGALWIILGTLLGQRVWRARSDLPQTS